MIDRRTIRSTPDVRKAPWGSRGTWLVMSGALIFVAALAPTGCDARRWVAEGETRLQAGRSCEALVCADRALERDGEDARAWCLRGRALTHLGRHREALLALEYGHDLGSDAPALSPLSTTWLVEARALAERDAESRFRARRK